MKLYSVWECAETKKIVLILNCKFNYCVNGKRDLSVMTCSEFLTWKQWNPKREMVIYTWPESERSESSAAICGDVHTHLTLTGHAGQLFAKHSQMEGKWSWAHLCSWHRTVPFYCTFKLSLPPPTLRHRGKSPRWSWCSDKALDYKPLLILPSSLFDFDWNQNHFLTLNHTWWLRLFRIKIRS